MKTENIHPCRRSIYIEGSARPGTAPSMYDPGNILGGAQYEICGKEGFHRKENGAWLCKQHWGEEKATLKMIEKCNKKT